MKARLTAAGMLALGFLFAPLTAKATDAKVVLTVHHAGCVLCEPIVKSTLQRLPGVSIVTVSQADGNADVIAVVNFNDAQTSPEAMIKATTELGYPAEVANADVAKETNG